jgi:hypothetical protein
MNSNSNHLLAFIGGFIGAMTHYVNSINILLNLKIDELFDFTIHSLIGGAIMLAVKVLGDWCIHKIKNPAKKDNNKEVNQNDPK